MASKDLVRLDEDRQVRSYHKAFAGELTLYRLGKDIRLWRPISARQIFWSAGLVGTAFVFAQIVGLRLPLWSTGWFAYYFLAPCGLGWLFAKALIEGRQLHVVLSSWIRQSAYGRNLSGGYRRVGRNTPLRKTRIKVQSSYETRPPSPLWCSATALVIIIILVAVGVGMPLKGSTHHARPRPTADVPLSPTTTPQPLPSVLVSAPGARAVRTAAARRVSSPRRRAAARHRHHHRRAVVHKSAPRSTSPRVVLATPSNPVTITHSAPVYASPTPTPDPVTRKTNPKAVVKLSSYRPHPDPAPSK